MTLQDSAPRETTAAPRPGEGRGDVPDGLRWCLHGVAALALIVAVGQVFMPWIGGGWAFAYVLGAKTIAALVVVGVILRYIPLADVPGARARRNLARMLGAFALTADLQMRSALGVRSDSSGRIEDVVPLGVVGLCVVAAMVIIRHVAYLRSRALRHPDPLCSPAGALRVRRQASSALGCQPCDAAVAVRRLHGVRAEYQSIGLGARRRLRP